MDEQLKKRLVGGAVLVALVVIFLPMLMEDDSPLEEGFSKQPVPPAVLDQQGFQSKALPLPGEGDSVIAPIEPMIEPPPVFVPPREPALTEGLTAPEKIDPAPEQKKPVSAASSAPKKGAGGWVVQVVSVTHRDRADKLAKQLQSSNFSAFVQKALVKGVTWYRVRVGPEQDKKRIESVLARLESKLAPAGLKPQIVTNR